MDLNDIKQLIASGNPKLILHALAAWEREHAHQPEPIIGVLKSDNIAVLEAALKAASTRHPKVCAPYVAALMQSPDPAERKLAVKSASPAMGKIVADSLKQLFSTESDVVVLALAATAAAHLNLGIEYVEMLLEHEDIRIRANAVGAITAIGSDRVRELLEPRLKDSAIRVQNEAMMGLARLIPEAELEKLVLTRLSSADVSVRAATAYVAGELPLANRVDILSKVLNDPELQVVKCATRALCSLDDLNGPKIVTEAYWRLPLSPLEESFARSLAATDSRLLLQNAEKAAHEGIAKTELVRKVLIVAGVLPGNPEFTPWINAALELKDAQLRLQALQMVAKFPGNHKAQLPKIIEWAEHSTIADEMALGALIRWRSGQLTGFGNLKTMLFSGRPVEAKAAAEVLRLDNGLIARRLLHEAQVAGIIQGPPAQQPDEDFEQPISLPID